jgi:hypothetical protein
MIKKDIDKNARDSLGLFNINEILSELKTNGQLLECGDKSDGQSSDSCPSEDNLDANILAKIVPGNKNLAKKLAQRKKDLKRLKAEKLRKEKEEREAAELAKRLEAERLRKLEEERLKKKKKRRVPRPPVPKPKPKKVRPPAMQQLIPVNQANQNN